MVAFFRRPGGGGDVEAGKPVFAPRRLPEKPSPLRCALAAAALAAIAVLALDPARGWVPALPDTAARHSAAAAPPPPPPLPPPLPPQPQHQTGALEPMAPRAGQVLVEEVSDAAPAAQEVDAAEAEPVGEVPATELEAPLAAVAEEATVEEVPRVAGGVAEDGSAAEAPEGVGDTKEPPVAGMGVPAAAAEAASTAGAAAAEPAATVNAAGTVQAEELAVEEAAAESAADPEAHAAPVDEVILVPDPAAGVVESANRGETGGELASDIRINASLLLMPEGEALACAKIISDLVVAKGSKVSYLEFGSGGSTTEFTQFTSEMVSIEHDQEWCGLVGERLAEKGISNVRQLCVSQEEGEAGRSGRSEGNGVSFRTYLNAVDMPGLPANYDFVYIDGRARLGAALKVLPYLTDESVVVLHDAVRTRYDGVDAYYETVKTVMNWANPGGLKNGLRIMRRRQDLPKGTWPISDAQIDEAYNRIPQSEVML